LCALPACPPGKNSGPFGAFCSTELSKTLGNNAQPLGTLNNVQPLTPVNTVPSVQPASAPAPVPSSAPAAVLFAQPVAGVPLTLPIAPVAGGALAVNSLQSAVVNTPVMVNVFLYLCSPND
jgi:hypothetical protein